MASEIGKSLNEETGQTDFDAEVSSIDIVPQEEVVCLHRVSTKLRGHEVHEIKVLAMYVTHNCAVIRQGVIDPPE
jgi:hypothetical protein